MKKIDLEIKNFTSENTKIKNVEIEKSLTINVLKNKEIELFDEPTFAKLKDFDFSEGVIEVDVFSKLLPDAPDFARGFLGVAFNIDEKNTSFDSFYVRPTNGKVDDPMRSNRASQYFAYPEYKFDRLRELEWEGFENSANIDIEEWIHLRIEIQNGGAKFFINNETKPNLVIKKLLSKNNHGQIALWSEVGSDAYFKNLTITNLIK